MAKRVPMSDPRVGHDLEGAVTNTINTLSPLAGTLGSYGPGEPDVRPFCSREHWSRADLRRSYFKDR